MALSKKVEKLIGKIMKLIDSDEKVSVTDFAEALSSSLIYIIKAAQDLSGDGEAIFYLTMHLSDLDQEFPDLMAHIVSSIWD
jgi:hypothetical protein